ncbi:MAG: hypothetical protein HQL21_07925 [Candidatus Omnitrophica bacterium]|nr:hypothetical protein [Candidatus Omnitrophota bacterium]
MANVNMVALGARVPEDLKDGISEYCRERGIKMQFFVIEALREKFLEIQEDAEDAKMASERMRNPEFVSFEEFEKYIAARKKVA